MNAAMSVFSISVTAPGLVHPDDFFPSDFKRIFVVVECDPWPRRPRASPLHYMQQFGMFRGRTEDQLGIVDTHSFRDFQDVLLGDFSQVAARATGLGTAAEENAEDECARNEKANGG